MLIKSEIFNQLLIALLMSIRIYNILYEEWKQPRQKGRNILEIASPVFFSRLTINQSKEIKDCQRKAFAIILQADFHSYSRALERLGQEESCCHQVWCVKNPKHTDLFLRSLPCRADIRGQRQLFQEYFCRTDRLFDSSPLAIARLLNEKYRVFLYPKDLIKW